jgi:cytoskeletal protein CcmA (bactofilin family)
VILKHLLGKGVQKEEPLEGLTPQAYSSEGDASWEEPELTIGEHVVVKGTLAFEHLARIDGYFEGEVDSKGKIVVGPTAIVKANLNLQEAFISGKVEGDIIVKDRLVLRGRAEIKGNITAPVISVDEGVSIMGQVYVTAPAPAPASP